MAAEISGPIPSPSIRVTHWGHWENINLAKILVQWCMDLKIICALPVPLCCWLWPPNEAEYPLSFLPVKRALFPISSCCMSGSIVWYEGALLMEKKKLISIILQVFWLPVYCDGCWWRWAAVAVLQREFEQYPQALWDSAVVGEERQWGEATAGN